jgi:hypothetical protein
LRKHITGTKDPMPWLSDSNKRASGKTGAVHLDAIADADQSRPHESVARGLLGPG